MAWEDAGVRELVVKQFVPAADEVEKLERGDTFASRFFQEIATRHFTDLHTTQGTYMVAPSGALLGFGHVLDPVAMMSFLRKGLQKWNALSQDERLGDASDDSTRERASLYPEDGLVLGVVLRKFYERQPRTERERRGLVEWNKDFAWFRRDEARRFLSAAPEKGGRHEVPSNLVNRLARYHFTDTVRAFADPYPSRCIETAQLTSTVLGIQGSLISLGFEGAVRMSQSDLPRHGYSHGRLPRKPSRSYDAKLLGYATFDLDTDRFLSFDLVALGPHQGGGERSFDAPTTLGIVLSLAGDRPMDRVEPFHLRLYGW